VSPLALLFVLLAGMPGDPGAAEQDKRKRIQDLMMRADQENRKGNAAEANRCLAEAWALTAEVYYEEGKLTASNEAWSQAKRYGWAGEAPAEKARRRPTAPPAPPSGEASRTAPGPIEPPAPPPQPPRNGAARRQEEPLRPGYQQPAPRPKPKDPWPYLAMAPYHGPRNNCWSGLLNTPPLEEALVLPPGAWLVRGTVDISSADWSAEDEGGESLFKAAFLTESLEVDYGLSDQFLVGLRFTLGELGQGGDDPLRVWEQGRQVVPTEDRAFAMESLVGRFKYAGSAGFVDVGFLAEVKFPLASEDDFLTSGSIDFGLSGILTKRWKEFSVTLNAGIVFPVGDSELFSENDEVDLYFHGGLGAGWKVHERLVLLAQFEFNTGAFGELAVLDGMQVMAVSAGARYKLTAGAFLSGSFGTGLTEESGDLFLSSGLDVVF